MAGKLIFGISNFVKRTKGRLDGVIRDVLWGLASDIVLTTPVDTGQARGNWLATLDRGPLCIKTGILDKEGEKTLDHIKKVLEGVKAGKTKTIWLTNTLPYIVRLEYGWSKQAPTGMVRMALMNIKAAAGIIQGKG